MSDSPSIDVLAERLTHLLTAYEGIKSVNEQQSKALQEVSELRADIRVMNQHTERLFETLKEHSALIGTHGQQLQAHSTIWKICGAVLVAASGLIGWGYSTIQSLRDADANADHRIMGLEYEVRHIESVSHETINKTETDIAR